MVTKANAGYNNYRTAPDLLTIDFRDPDEEEDKESEDDEKKNEKVGWVGCCLL